ncbi:hypothetical protein AGMMS50239_15190 [Bacteroidia bacterium]|nr:hypothetical protein AGMMS50239_15190 [Bacteroidia bacterium]
MRKYDICYSCQADKDLDGLFEVIVFAYGVPKTAFKYVQGIIETIENLFYGKSVVFTGTLTSIQRKDAMQIIADVGGIPENDITLKTNFLVVGQQNFNVVGKGGLSSKQKKALQLLEKGQGIEIISEQDFLKYIKLWMNL